MITFKQYNKYFCGIFILVCCLFGNIGIVEALDPVDISGKCVSVSISTGETIMPNDVCSKAGYGSCDDAAGTITAFINSDCTGVVVSAPMAGLNCNDGTTIIASGGSVKYVGILKCNPRTWGIVPQPDNVPGDFEQSIKNATDWILGFVAMIAVLMLIWGGINYLTSAGDEDKAKTGKKTIAYALIGLVVAGIAYAIVDVIITVIL